MGLTKAQLEALNDSSFPNNNAGAITPAILRDYNDAVITNTVNQDSYLTDSQSFDSRVDSLEAFSSSLDATFATDVQLNASSSTLQANINRKLDTSSFDAFSTSVDSRLDTLDSDKVSSSQTSSMAVSSSTYALTASFALNTLNVTTSSYADRAGQADTVYVGSDIGDALRYVAFTEGANYQQVRVDTIGGLRYNPATNTLVGNVISASSAISTSIINGLGNASEFSTSVDSRINAISIDTSSFATTGSNNFVGNQSIQGNLYVSSSTTSDVVVNGQVFISSSGLTTTTQPRLTVSGSAGQSVINRNSISTKNTTYTSFLNPGVVSMYAPATGDDMGFSVDAGAAGVSNWSTGPVIYVNDALDNYPAVFGFQNKANYTDGRVAVLTPLSASAGITASAAKISGLNYPIADGATDQFMTTDGAGNLSFDWVKTLHQNIHNAETTSIVRGTPLYISGSTGDNANVYFADASAANRRPATLIAGDATLAPGGTGTGLISGEIQGVDTSLYPEGTIVYLGVGGGWSATRPSGSNNLVQALGVITRQANNGRGIIFNQIGNNLPNIAEGYVWVGDSNGIPQAVATSSFVGGTIDTSSFITTGSLLTTQYISGSLIFTGSARISISTASFFNDDTTGNDFLNLGYQPSASAFSYLEAQTNLPQYLNQAIKVGAYTTGSIVGGMVKVVGNTSLIATGTSDEINPFGTLQVSQSLASNDIRDWFAYNGNPQTDGEKTLLVQRGLHKVAGNGLAFSLAQAASYYVGAPIYWNGNSEGSMTITRPTDGRVLRLGYIASIQDDATNPYVRQMWFDPIWEEGETLYNLRLSGSVSLTNSNLATTGSNSFVGNQSIQGNVYISSSTQNDVVVNGQVFISSSAIAGTTQPRLTVSGSGGQSIINRSSVSTRNTTTTALLSPSIVNMQTIATFDEIGFSVDAGAAGVSNWSTGPVIYVNDAGDNYPAVFGFQNKANYTDGRITALAPLVVSGSVSITSVMNLKPNDPLPSGNIGDLAVSGSSLYFYNGAWTLVI